jgi:hypothetical protein
MGDTFKESIIDQGQREQVLNISTQEDQKAPKNTFPKLVVKLEKFYDLQDKFKKTTNYKTNSSIMQYEVVNLGSEDNP